jgi:hypothetical protein
MLEESSPKSGGWVLGFFSGRKETSSRPWFLGSKPGTGAGFDPIRDSAFIILHFLCLD